MDASTTADASFGVYELYATLIFLGGIASIIYVSKNWKTWLSLRRPPGAWRLSAVDISLFAWGIICISLFAGYIGQVIMSYLPGGDGPIEDNTGLFIICSGAVMHGGFILLFSSWSNARRAFSDGPINTRSISLFHQIGYALVLLLAAFPIINIITLGWTFLLNALADFGLPVSAEKQDTVLILLENADNPVIFFGMMFIAAVLAPIGEELVFRAGIFRYLLSKTSALPAALISGALFGALHFSLFGIVPLSLLGFALCYAYYLTGNIRVPIIIHMIFNANTILLVWFFPEVAASL